MRQNEYKYEYIKTTKKGQKYRILINVQFKPAITDVKGLIDFIGYGRISLIVN